MSEKKTYRMGVDMGGTKIEAILISPTGKMLHRHRIPTPGQQEKKRYEAISNTLAGFIRETAAMIPDGSAYTLGIGIPGCVDPKSGLVLNANTTCLNGRPFKKDMETLLGRTVAMKNDANCFTLAESVQGAAAGHKMVFGVIMGTGCGGGICLDGKILEGAHGIAGEWGHISIDPNGPKCYCGSNGCVETLISGPGVEQEYIRRHGRHVRMRDIVEGHRAGQTDMTELFLEFLDHFGRALGGVISILDPDIVVLGGGLSNIDELYTLGVENVVRYVFHKKITTPIVKNELGDSAGVFGAAWIGE